MDPDFRLHFLCSHQIYSQQAVGSGPRYGCPVRDRPAVASSWNTLTLRCLLLISFWLGSFFRPLAGLSTDDPGSFIRPQNWYSSVAGRVRMNPFLVLHLFARLGVIRNVVLCSEGLSFVYDFVTFVIGF